MSTLQPPKRPDFGTPIPSHALLNVNIDLNKNEYLHKKRDVYNQFLIYLLQKYFRNTSISDKDMFKTGQIYILYCEVIHSHSYLFYIYQQEFLLIVIYLLKVKHQQVLTLDKMEMIERNESGECSADIGPLRIF